MIAFIIRLFRRAPQRRYDPMRVRTVMTPSQRAIAHMFQD